MGERSLPALLSSRLREEGYLRSPEGGRRQEGEISSGWELKQRWWVRAPLPGSSVAGTPPTLRAVGEMRRSPVPPHR